MPLTARGVESVGPVTAEPADRPAGGLRVTRHRRQLLTERFGRNDVARLRRLVSRQAGALGLAEPRRQDLVLAVDEIVTNTIRHGGGTGDLTIWVDQERLWFQVTDWGPGMRGGPPSKPPARHQLGGRGLWIAREITDELTIEAGPDGTIVTAAFALPGTGRS